MAGMGKSRVLDVQVREEQGTGEYEVDRVGSNVVEVFRVLLQ